jgi:hypothetical protein
VPQGDQNAAQGLYHSNAVDAVPPGQIVAATERIREAWLEPVRVAWLRQFPCRLCGFPSANGSEFIHQTVARLRNKLRIEPTKSRPRPSHHNGRVETNKGAWCASTWATATAPASTPRPFLTSIYAQPLNPYLNYPRPCAPADLAVDEKGRQRPAYRR